MPDPMPAQAVPPGGGREGPSAGGSDVPPRWHKRLAIGLIVLAGIVMLVASLTVWVKRQALNTDNWVEASSQLLQDDQVRHAVSVAVVDAAFQNAEASGELGSRLPPALQPLSAQLAATLHSSAVNVADQILASTRVQNTWEEINRVAHQAFIAVVENNKGRDAQGDVAIDLNPLVTQVRARLGLPPPPSDAGRYVILHNDQINELQTAVNAIRKLSLFLWIAVLVLFGVAIWLARGWRHAAVSMTGWTLVAVGLALLVIRRIVGNAVVDSLAGDSQNRGAATAIWSIETTLLRDSAQAILALGVLIVVGAWLSGPSRRAVAVRRWLAPWFSRRPVVVYGSFVVFALFLLLILPTGGGRRLVGLLVLFALILAGLEALKRMTQREFPSAAADGPR